MASKRALPPPSWAAARQAILGPRGAAAGLKRTYGVAAATRAAAALLHGPATPTTPAPAPTLLLRHRPVSVPSARRNYSQQQTGSKIYSFEDVSSEKGNVKDIRIVWEEKKKIG